MKRMLALARNVVKGISVEPIMFIYMMTLYYYVPASNSLYLYKICRTTFNYNISLCEDLVASRFDNSTKGAEDNVSAESSKWYFYQTVVFVIPSVIVSWLLGSYADRRGRLLPIVLPFSGQIASCIAHIILAKLETAPVSFMLICPVLTGTSGGFAALTMGCYSHIATVASPDNRTIRLTVLQACMSAGIIIGSFTVGFILDQSIDPVPGWVNTFTAIIVLIVITLIYTIFRLWWCMRRQAQPSPPENVTHHHWSPLEVFRTVCAGWPSVLQLTIVVILLLYVTGLGKFDVLYQFTQRMKLNRSMYGIYQGIDAAVGAIAGVISTLVLKKVLYWCDTTLSILGMISSIICVTLIGLSGTAVPVSSQAFAGLWWFSPFAGLFGIISGTSMRSVASSLTSVADQGKLYAFISSGDAALQLCTAGLYNYLIWPITEENYPGIPYFCTAVLILIALLLTFLIRSRLTRTHEMDPLIPEEATEQVM